MLHVGYFNRFVCWCNIHEKHLKHSFIIYKKKNLNIANTIYRVKDQS